MTTNERFEQLMAAIASTNAAVSTTNATVSTTLSVAAENTRAIAEINRSLVTVRDSIKSLEVVAETLLESANKHEAVIANLEEQWQAYVNTLPQH